MLDFTSALYLGLQHPSRSLKPWTKLTMGVPAALALPPRAESLARELAVLQGCERATLGTSTLHLFWDLFGQFPPREFAVYLDDGAYPIAGWGIERAAARGVRVRGFAHYDPRELRGQLRRDALAGRRPIVVADGFCPACGRPAPVRELVETVRSETGYLVLDDTQALGILGHRATKTAPYGRGGGGSLKRNGVFGPEVILVSSLAKGFGVPMAAISGTAEFVRDFEERSETRVHCSPPSIATIHAAEHALAMNRKYGDALRLRLVRLVQRFRSRLGEAGLSATGGLFPVQTLARSPANDVSRLHRDLLAGGVRAVLHRGRRDAGPRISFIVTARHRPEEIDHAVEVLRHAALAKPIRTLTRETRAHTEALDSD